MSTQPTSKRKFKRTLVKVILALAGLSVLALAIGDRLHLFLLKNDLNDPDPQVRSKVLIHIASERYQPATELVHEALVTEQDRNVLENAGYAAMRVKDSRGVLLLRRRVDQGPDDPVRARLIVFAARLASRDLRLLSWLEQGADSPEPWRRIGSAVGLLELGQPRGGELIIEYARQADPAGRQFAIEEFKRIAGPLTETIGRPIEAWPCSYQQPSCDEQWSELEKVWHAYATVDLLNDVLTRLHRSDRKRYELGRLAHARDKLTKLF